MNALLSQIEALKIPLALKSKLINEFIPRWDDVGQKSPFRGISPDKNSVRLDGNDYLCLSGAEKIVLAQIQALLEVGSSVIQSVIMLESGHIGRRFEESLAQWIGKGEVFLAQSGYAANVGLIQTIAGPTTPVYLDMQAHASLWEGAHTARAPSHAFRHNDANSLELLIKKHGPGIVAVDSVYSSSGSICPLKEILEVVERNSCFLLVDESHSIGTHGPKGAGLCAELGLTERVHFITASLSKAFAGRAGFYTLPSCMKYYAYSASYSTVFSSCLLPHEIAGLNATLELIQNSDDARAKLHANSRRIRKCLTEYGFTNTNGTEQIICLEAGPEADTVKLRETFDSHDIFGAVFIWPATAKNRSMLRFTVNSGLTEDQLIKIENVIPKVAELIRPEQWRISRRQTKSAQATSPGIAVESEISDGN